MTMLPMDRACMAFDANTDLDEIVEKSLKQAALWEEVKDKLHAVRSYRFQAGSSNVSALRVRWRSSRRSF